MQPVYLIDPTTEPIKTGLGPSLYNNVTNENEKQLTPTMMVSLGPVTAVGPTAVWTPATGKRFRMMGYQIVLAAGTTAAAGSTLTLSDDATDIVRIAICGAAMAAPGVPVVLASVNLPGNGYLSTTADNALNLALSTALAVGGVCVNVFGVEE